MSDWISVDEYLPPVEQRCLIFTEAGDMMTGWRQRTKYGEVYWCFGHNCASWDFEFCYNSGAVTHWMQLPGEPE